MRLAKIMSTPVVTVAMDDPLSTVKDIFDNTHFHHLLVVADKQLVGIISDRDLLKALSPNLGKVSETSQDLATLNKRVHQIMTRHPITASENQSVHDAIEIFNNNRISCIPIINADNIPVGILSWRDILKLIKPKSS